MIKPMLLNRLVNDQQSPGAPSALSYNARKALIVHVGESAGNEIADLLKKMANEIEELRRTKVSITAHRSGNEPH